MFIVVVFDKNNAEWHPVVLEQFPELVKID